jgi:hypothetical protein
LGPFGGAGPKPRFISRTPPIRPLPQGNGEKDLKDKKSPAGYIRRGFFISALFAVEGAAFIKRSSLELGKRS